jgi:Fe-S-cluster containining protein
MTTKCGIYNDRPEVCRIYPKVDQWIPPECTFYFTGGVRNGDCSCGTSACCEVPRVGGDPGGAPMPREAGGLPCRHIVVEEEEKTAQEHSETEDPNSENNDFIKEAVGGDTR